MLGVILVLRVSKVGALVVGKVDGHVLLVILWTLFYYEGGSVSGGAQALQILVLG